MDIVAYLVIGAVVGIFINYLANVLPPPHPVSPLRAPIVILVNALAFSLLTLHFQGVPLVLAAIYTAIFMLVLVIDFELRLILNVVILPAIAFAVLASPFSQIGMSRSLLGGAVALVVVWGIYGFATAFVRLRGYSFRVPFGFGDVKLGVFMGVVTGFPSVFTAIILGILFGGIGALLFLAFYLYKEHRLALRAAIPYGPFFCLSGWIVFVSGIWSLFA